MTLALATVSCCKQDATVVGKWGAETPCGKKMIMELNEDGTAKMCPEHNLKLAQWTKAENVLVLSGERFCQKDSAFVAFTDSMQIAKLTADSLQITTSCGKTLKYARVACCKDKANCSGECDKDGKHGCKGEGEKACCKDGEKAECAADTTACKAEKSCCEKAAE